MLWSILSNNDRFPKPLHWSWGSQGLCFLWESGFFSDLQVQRSLPSLEAGPVATKLAFPIPLGWQQVAQWDVDVVCSVPKVDKYVFIQIQPTKWHVALGNVSVWVIRNLCFCLLETTFVNWLHKFSKLIFFKMRTSLGYLNVSRLVPGRSDWDLILLHKLAFKDVYKNLQEIFCVNLRVWSQN